MARVAEQSGGAWGELRQRSPERVERRVHLAPVAGELRRLCCSEPFTCGNELLERLAVAPVELVHRPDGQQRLGQCLDRRRVLGAPGGLQCDCQRIPGGGEFAKRKLKERVDVWGSGCHP